MDNKNFTGDKKVGQSLLGPWERRMIEALVPRIPSQIRSYHLTLATIPISLFIVVFSYLARFDLAWLWLVSVLIVLQWLTDSFDGALGRYRKEGLIKWGYYMDHFLDYVFLCAILIGYSLMIPDAFKYLQFFVLAIFGAFMVNSYLAFATTNRFQISHLGIGPTEVRIIFIVINTLLLVFGKTYLASALPVVLVLSLFGLCVVVYRTQKEIWDEDKKENKDKIVK